MIVAAAIDLIGGQCVRLYQGDFTRQTTYSQDPVEQAQAFQAAGFSRLHVVDLEAARAGRGKNRDTVRRLVDAVDFPVQVGGGVRSAEDVAELFEMGVEYLILGTAALNEADKVQQWIQQWGPGGFIVSLDLKRGRLRSGGWLEESDQRLETVLHRISDWGIGQVICTDVDSDGTLQHPNYDTYRRLREELPGRIKLLAAGGVSLPEHVSRLGGLDVQGVVVGRALYEGGLVWEDLINAG